MIFDIVSNLCTSRGVTYKTVESACGLSNGTIGKLKTSMVSADKLKKIADYFGVPMEYLLTGEAPEYYTDPEAAKVAQEIFDNPDLRILFDAAKDASPDDLKLTAEMLKRMKATNPDG